MPTDKGGYHTLANAPFGDQLAHIFANLDAIMLEAGATGEQVTKVTDYLADIAWWQECNALCAEYFGAVLPPRCIVPVSWLHHGYLVELEAVVAVAR